MFIDRVDSREKLPGSVEKAFVLIGPPTSGKTTQTQYLSAVSGGVILRGKDVLPEDAGFLAQSRDLIPDNRFIPAMLSKLNEQTARKIILDNIPRSPKQAVSLVDWAKEKGTSLFVVRLRLTESEVVERGVYRLTCNSCGSSYHNEIKPPRNNGLCDKDGTILEKRAGDKPELLKKSFKMHMQEADLITGILNRHYPVFDISASGKIEDATVRMMAYLGNLV